MTIRRTLLHMCTEAEWAAVRRPDGDGRGSPTPGAVAAGSPAPASLAPASLAEVGFVHLSTPEQVHLPANRLFAGRDDVVLLVLDQDRLPDEIRWEPGVPGDPDSMRFPHLYAPLPLAAVTDVRPYRPGADGSFMPPVLDQA
ncbi:DUF952 domain-containing protein [Gordonia sp. CPCC 206044]|uniref:DUF952 domain-containing protein n=1 Tax=Gordonia sp. CPCC 206044 TaxID=3140793 RepID=UPI003AF34297